MTRRIAEEHVDDRANFIVSMAEKRLFGKMLGKVVEEIAGQCRAGLVWSGRQSS